MSTPNPLAPQGSLLEKQARSKSTLQVAALIVGLHVFGLGGFLIVGCNKDDAKRPDTGATTAATNEVVTASAPDTNAPVQAGTNAIAAAAQPVGASAPVGAAAGTTAGVGTSAGTAPVGAAVGAAADASAGAAAPTGSAGEYKIQKGDIAFNLAKKNNVSLKALQEANPNVDLKKLKVGATLQIPAAGAPSEAKAAKAVGAGAAAAADSAADTTAGDVTVYHVKGGDSLGKIAKRHGTTVKAIRALNSLSNDNIRVGQKLKLPAKSAAAAAAPATAVPESPAAAPIAAPVASPVPGAK